jgi:hypothetical protein
MMLIFSGKDAYHLGKSRAAFRKKIRKNPGNDKDEPEKRSL